MKIEITKAQLIAIMDLVDDISAMIGVGSFSEDDRGPDKDWTHKVKLVDRMLKKNGYKRNFK